MEKTLYHEMCELETTHWWFRAKHRIVSHLIAAYSPRRQPLRLLDLGCGTGAMIAGLERLGEIVGVDCSPEAVAYAGTRTRARLIEGRLPEVLERLPGGGFDCVLMLDLLEHLEDDGAALRGARRLLSDGGILIATVPAYQWLFSPRDAYHHHLRRYGARRFRDLLEGGGYQVLLFSHYNALLFPPALLSRLWDKARRKEPGPDLRLPPSPVNRALEEVFAAERFFLPRTGFPWGLSLIAVARA